MLLLLQIPDVTVHWKRLSPRPRPVTGETGMLAVTTVAPPDNTLHEPLPMLGLAPFKVEEPVQLLKVEPASDTTLLLTTNSSLFNVQALFVTVHVKTLLPWPRPVTPVLATDG